MSALLERVQGGARWAAGAHLARHALHFATLLVLARWLAPAVFGEFAILALVVGVVRLLADVGFGAALVQQAEIEDRDVDTVFWAGAALALLLGLATAVAAGPAARFFGAPELAGPLRLYALSFLGLAGTQVPLALLQRRVDFRRIAVHEITSQCVFSATAIALAARGGGVECFVVAHLLGDAASVGVLLALTGYRPRTGFDRRSLARLFGFGGRVVGLRVLNHAASRLDTLLIGRLAGLHALGLYGMASHVIRLPEQHVSQLLKRVLFPAFSRIQHQPERLASHYVRLVGYVALVTFPFSAGVALVFPDFVALCLGPRWVETVPLVRVLALAGALFSVGGTIGIASWALGRPDVDLRLAWLRLVGMGALLVPGARHGALGVAVATAAYTLLTFPVYLWVVHRLLGVGPARMLRTLWPALYATAVMAAVVAAVLAALGPHAPGAAPRLAAAIAAGVLAYGGALWAPRNALFLELLRVLRGRVPGAGAPGNPGLAEPRPGLS